jgi:tetratricopeptide (TPR) repeat protein/predicted Ser/Thr protein kinase
VTPARGAYPSDDRLGGRYELLETVGRGAQGEVWLARDHQRDRRVAIKARRVRSDAERRAVSSEARVLLDLPPHPGIPVVRDDFVASDRYYLVMDWIEGRSLAQILKDVGSPGLSFDVVATWVTQIAEALDHLHHHTPPVVHHDVKPQNIVVRRDGRAVLVDFALSESQPTRHYAHGTPHYIAPELLVGSPATTRSDIYSLAVTTFVIMNGTVPTSGAEVNVSTVPDTQADDVRHAIAAGLAIDPDRRPPSAGAFAAAFSHRAAATRAFVGRASELAELNSGLRRVIDGQGYTILVSGEAGIGKTSLLTTFALGAAASGVRVLWGRCWEGKSSPAYLPFVQIARSIVREADEAALAELGPHAKYLARIVPELSGDDPHRGADEITLLFDAVTALLTTSARHRPLVLLIDDLHLADRSTARLLRHVTRTTASTGVLIVGAYRDRELRADDHLSALVDALGSSSPVLAMTGLELDDVQRLLSDAFASLPMELDIAQLHDATRGNPFFLDELVRLLGAEAGRASEAQPPVPETVRESVRRRLSLLTEETREALRLCAVAGRGFDIATLETAAGTGSQALAIQEATDAGILRPDNEPKRHTFSHDVFQESIYAELSATERQEFHLRIGEAMELAHPDGIGERLPELAHHFFWSLPLGSAERAARYSRRAGRQAIDQMAYEQAVGHFERGIDALDQDSTSDDHLRCELSVDLGDARWNAWDAVASAGTMLQAAELAARIDRWDLLARAARGMNTSPAWKVDHPLSVFNTALGLLGTKDPSARAHVLATIVEHLQFTADRRAMLPLAMEAVSLARSSKDQQALQRALAAQRLALDGGPDAAARGALSKERLALLMSDPRHDLTHEFSTRTDRINDLLVVGDRAGAEVEIEAARALARVYPSPMARWATANWDTMLCVIDGRLDEAAHRAQEAWAESLVDDSDAQGRHSVSGALLLVESAVRTLRGGWAELVGILRVALERTPWPAVRSGLALALADAGQTAEAHAELGVLANDRFSGVPRDSLWTVTAIVTTETCVLLREVVVGETLYEELVPLEGLCEPGGPWSSASFGSVARSLGQLAGLLGRYDDAFAHFEQALALNERIASPPWIARTAADYADALDLAGGAGNTARAADLRARARPIAEALGLSTLVERLDNVRSSET